jgi:hypothetical protein
LLRCVRNKEKLSLGSYGFIILACDTVVLPVQLKTKTMLRRSFPTHLCIRCHSTHGDKFNLYSLRSLVFKKVQLHCAWTGNGRSPSSTPMIEGKCKTQDFGGCWMLLVTKSVHGAGKCDHGWVTRACLDTFRVAARPHSLPFFLPVWPFIVSTFSSRLLLTPVFSSQTQPTFVYRLRAMATFIRVFL